MSANSIDQGMAEGEEAFLDMEDPARAWCDLVAACKLPVNSMAKNDAIKAILVEASKSKWTHELLDECEADTVVDLTEWEDDDAAFTLSQIDQGNQEALPGHLSHDLDCDCAKCFKSRAKFYGKAEARTKVTARPNGAYNSYECRICGQRFESHYWLQKHREAKHPW